MEFAFEKVQEYLRIFAGGHPPDTLYHYTSGETLKAILDGSKLRAGDLRYMNDFRELSDGRELIKDEFLKFMSSTANPAIGAISKEAIQYVESWDALSVSSPQDVTFMMGGVPMNVFAMSLSEQGDLLSQWRGYADSARGYSVGFNPSELVKISEKCACAKFLGLGKVTYDVARKKTYVNQIFGRWDKWSADSDPKAAIVKARDYFEHMVQPLFSILGTIFKQAGFAEENEWRLIFVKSIADFDNIECYVRDSLHVPFLSFEIPEAQRPMAIGEICVGPKQSHPNIKTFLQGYGEHRGFDFEVTHSRVSYR